MISHEKVYRVIAGEDATTHGYIRVVDESGEDYAFDANRFHKVEFPPTVEATLDSALR